MRESNKQKVSMLELAIAASDEAAKEVVRLARQTKTPIVIWEDGQVKQIPASRFRLSLKRGKAKPPPSPLTQK